MLKTAWAALWPRIYAGPSRRGLTAGAGAGAALLHVSDEVADAVRLNKPVVALESTIYTHGALGKDLARQHETLVRSRGAIPAIVALVDGVPSVGVSAQDIARIVDDKGTVKVSRRDVAYLAGMVSLPVSSCLEAWYSSSYAHHRVRGRMETRRL